MTELVVRRLLMDLETPFARHSNGGDAFTALFLIDLLRQTVRKLWHDGCLMPWRDDLGADFHASQHDAERSQRWLLDNRRRFTVVGRQA